MHPRAPAMRIFKALVKLQEHDILRDLSLNDISQYARLVGHLKNDILLPQPLNQTDPSVPPEVLSSSVAGFLSDALEIDEEYIQDSWDILKFDCTTMFDISRFERSMGGERIQENGEESSRRSFRTRMQDE